MNKWIRSALATTFFVVCLAATYLFTMRYTRVDVVFYDAILAGVVAAGLAVLPLFLSKRFADFSALERVQLCMIWLLLGYSFAISVPTVIDRSLSFYILEKLQQRGGGIREDRFQDVFVQEYMVEHRLVDVRLTEQSESGTIVIENGCVRLTPRGERMAHFSRFFRAYLLPKQRLLKGRYSDDLTDPFRNSRQDVDYRCR
jgi:hypothetical protein